MTIRRLFIAVILAGVVGTAPAAADDLVAAGEKAFVKCNTCHLIGQTKRVRSTPHLNELFGRTPGSLPDIKYSEALVAYGRDKVWDEATLTAFLRDPQGLVKGTKMAFLGLTKDDEMKAILAYMATFDKDGMAPK